MATASPEITHCICKARSLLMPWKMEEKSKTKQKNKGTVFVFTGSAKPRADTDVT